MPDEATDAPQESVRITHLEAENVKRLKAIAIDAGDRAVIEVSGRNGQGKSSVLDSIAYAIGGQRLCPPDPVNREKKKAHVTVELSNGLTVTRTWNRATSKLVVTRGKGQAVVKPQALMDDLFDLVSFDVLEFSRKQAAQQRTMLLELLGLDDALEAINTKKSVALKDRRAATTDIERVTDELNALPSIPDDLPDEPPDVDKLIAQLDEHVAAHQSKAAKARELAAVNESLDVLDRQRIDAEKDLERARNAVKEHEARIEHIDSKFKAYRTEKSQLMTVLDAWELPDLDYDKEQIRAAGTISEQCAQRERRESLRATLAKSERWYEDADKRNADCIRETERLLTEAQFPIEGLSFDEDGLLYNGLPLEQAAQSEQLKVACSIAMAMDPKLKVLLVRDGSLLDSDTMLDLCNYVRQHGWQLWIESVGSGAPGAVIIEDGEIVEVAGE